MAGLNSNFSKEPQGRAAYCNLLRAACCEDYRQQIETAQGKKEIESSNVNFDL
jgi:hypothetical protein